MKREWANIVWLEVKIGTIGRLVGGIVGAAILILSSDRQTYSLVFGFTIAFAVFLSVSGIRVPFTNLSLMFMSGISGLMGIITSVGAPPMALVYQSRTAASARPTMAAFFGVGCAISLLGLYILKLDI